ncbi:hypothetical protein Tco_1386749 [Tanacetum coccineum]
MVEEGFMLESGEMGSLVVVEHHSRKKERDEGHWRCLVECWNLKNSKTLTVVPAGQCLWPNSTDLLQRAPASADDELYWPRFEEMEETLEQPLGLLEFRAFSSFNLQELVHVGNRVKSVVVNGITTWIGASSLIWRGESSHDQQDRIHRAMDKGDWFGHA